MQASKLSADLAGLQTDIAEVERRHSLRMEFSLEEMGVLASSNDLPGTSSDARRGGSLSGLLPPICRSSIYDQRATINMLLCYLKTVLSCAATTCKNHA
ncbi:hypothetical protein BRADI_5g06730v3 [Brachypodium distachyon]|uniref:Uncharacterized protein n=1 Tax=Brachypodium distachyon TaxID=15368 RepID=A0A0Q3KQC1_BRADI|nr:hypothetical protein BRADI_5g06730v3 [Brachypodium distachyon]PNT60846.1 hypothetical protein BRADI_5g06730v3 [Brachypodium distachyon]